VTTVLPSLALAKRRYVARSVAMSRFVVMAHLAFGVRRTSVVGGYREK
jgi:hypothetical protein